MELRFSRSARRHRIGRAHALYVIETTAPDTVLSAAGQEALLWIGTDETGRGLEIVGLPRSGDPAAERPRDRRSYILIIHVMPTEFRRNK